MRRPIARGVWAAFVTMGLFDNVLPLLLIVWGQHRIATDLAAIVTAATPLFTVLVVRSPGIGCTVEIAGL